VAGTRPGATGFIFDPLPRREFGSDRRVRPSRLNSPQPTDTVKDPESKSKGADNRSADPDLDQVEDPDPTPLTPSETERMFYHDSRARTIVEGVVSELRARRRDRGILTAELADLCGLRLETLQQVEDRQTDPTIPVLTAMSTALGVPLGGLISRLEAKFDAANTEAGASSP